MQDKKQQLVSSSGEPLGREQDTGRGKERAQENTEFVSVIVKRTDETFRHPDDILEKAIGEGLEQISRPGFSLLLSSMAAGMILCFTVLAVAIMATLVPEQNHGFGRVVLAAAYPLGFVLCILSRTQLFTEHTATAVYPVLDRRASPKGLFKLWGIVIAGNLIGGAASSGLLIMAEPVIHAKAGYLLLAEHLLGFPVQTLFISAILAGWLMALGAWIVLATYSTLSQIVCIYIVTFLIGLGGFHHSIAGSIELFAAYFSTNVLQFSQLPPVIITVLAGNLVGGSIFVAVLNYGHIRHSQRQETKRR
ncbi:formate/nitrite transporter family protein [Aliiglaciecola sp. CAU 1673]|uniref:formate/nitrite transporter family protein n=1 Tax=Aliiglaciecola sp. CAU 1673 TaxID=3032595 RepID=UPI0023D9ACE7|nr:formate/nitrite transporter family protein [Aliiglaciecola sp. CAU 1673]MDF2179236.1 formate/nitrite transporter family protein [Aliiglaciecola sp. CAU 1673]